ncbi:Uncharacterised protein [Acinetobacter baumannii]|nr:Uncharacterised protein [Acinetobacter baumannii]
MNAVERVQRQQNRRMLDNTPYAQRSDRQEPQRHDRPEHAADARGTQRLNGEQTEQNHHRRRQNIGLRRRKHDVQPFEGREHRDGRRDGAVAVNERGAEQAGEQHQRPGFSLADQQRHQRHDAALAAVADAHGEHGVFERSDDHQRPEDQRQQTQDHRRRRRVAGEKQHGFQGVQRAGADIAEHHAQCAQRQRRQPRLIHGFRIIADRHLLAP